MQSRLQSASAHKKKGWHALQQGAAPQPSQSGPKGTTSAVYVRPDRTVTANLSLDNSPSFPSLANFADVLPVSRNKQMSGNLQSDKQGLQPSPEVKPSAKRSVKPNPWASPVSKMNGQQFTNGASSAASNEILATPVSSAWSPAKQQQQDSNSMAMSDSEVQEITALLSTHPWAEPGLARVSPAAETLSCML